MPTRAGIHELTLPDTGQRYTLSIPRGYSRSEAVPLIVSLHFGGRVTPFFGRGLLEILVEPALRELGAIVVAPDATAGGWATSEAERAVLRLVDHIEANYAIDASRTLLTGYSMGGAGTWYLAPRHSERFRAAIPMAGRPQDAADDFAWEMPMYVLQGRDDELIPLAPTQALVAELKGRGAPIDIEVVDGITHFEMARFRPHLRAAIPWIRETWSR
jgi:predicted peptidase